MILLAIAVSLLLPAAIYLIMQGTKAYATETDGSMFLVYGFTIILILAIVAYGKTAALMLFLTKGLLP